MGAWEQKAKKESFDGSIVMLRRLFDIPFWSNAAIPSGPCRGYRNRIHFYILTFVLPQSILGPRFIRKLSIIRLLLRYIFAFGYCGLFLIIVIVITVLIRAVLGTVLALADNGTAMVELAPFSLLSLSLRNLLVECIPHYLLGYSCIVLFNFGGEPGFRMSSGQTYQGLQCTGGQRRGLQAVSQSAENLTE